MRKRLIQQDARTLPDTGWLDIENQATVEVTSEQPDHPIDFAFRASGESGWRASLPGVQTIRIIFDQPQRISRIRLRFTEEAAERTQEFALRWAPEPAQSFREIVRQRWTFSPQGSRTELEEYHVSLDAVSILELNVNPDVARHEAWASLEEFRIA
jgi:hypothetical protein